MARRLRQGLGLKQALLVALTGYGQEEDRRRSHEAGFNAHLVKPADVRALERLLARPACTGQEPMEKGGRLWLWPLPHARPREHPGRRASARA